MRVLLYLLSLSLSFSLLLLFVSIATACNEDTDCWLNGLCINSSCICDPGWIGENCTQLNLAPSPVIGAYGYSPNVSSWGGVPIYVDGAYHLYVAEMVNNCGLCTWYSNSRVIHSVSDSVTGPYKFVDQAIEVWSHNPQIAVDNSTGTPTYIIFHIGTGDGGNPKNCNSSKSDEYIEADPGALHYSNSVNGPWIPLNPPGYTGCNNPAPLIYPNGTLLLVCTWHAFTAPSFKGPYSPFPFQFTGNGGKGTWEDPFIWQDKRGHYHLLSHVWEGVGPLYSVRVGGLAYSLDGMTWVQTPDEPFTNKVNHTDGSTSAYSTRERPKLIFDHNTGIPLALFNGVGGVPGGDKDKCGSDWTFTLGQPIYAN